jgi:hypothetical protein
MNDESESESDAQERKKNNNINKQMIRVRSDSIGQRRTEQTKHTRQE